MNKSRRKVLNNVLDNFEELGYDIDKEEALGILRDSFDEIEMCADEEEEALDNLPESFMWSTKYDDLSDNVSDLRDACDDLDALIDQCEEDGYNYDNIKTEIDGIIQKITDTIYR